MDSVCKYHVVNGNTHKIESGCHYYYEVDAVKAAEKLAVTNPGTDYVVMRSVTKSVASPPVTTTRF